MATSSESPAVVVLTCPECKGGGFEVGGAECLACGGTGEVHAQRVEVKVQEPPANRRALIAAAAKRRATGMCETCGVNPAMWGRDDDHPEPRWCQACGYLRYGAGTHLVKP